MERSFLISPGKDSIGPVVISDLPLRNGIRVLPRRGGRPVTNEMVQELLEPKFCPETGLWDI